MMLNASLLHSHSPDASDYAWRATPGSQNLYRRRALGVEKRWVRKAQAMQPPCLLYLNGSLELRNPITKSDLEIQARAAWLALRCFHPEVDLKPSPKPSTRSQRDDGSVIEVECRILASAEEAQAWADKTFWFTSNDHHTKTEDRSSRANLRQAPFDHPVFLQIIAIEMVGNTGSEEGQIDTNLSNTVVSNIEFLFRVDHSCTDGIGVYVIANSYFKLLSECFDHHASFDLDWNASTANFSQPWMGLLNREQKFDGQFWLEERNKLVRQVKEWSVCGINWCSNSH